MADDMSGTESIDIVDVPEENRFQARIDGNAAGHVEYILARDLIVFTHTEVNPAFEGRGVGSAIARHTLDDARRRGLSVLPLCPFYQSWIERHPDYQDLVYEPPASQVTD